MDTRTPKHARQRLADGREPEELALAALAAPFPPEPQLGLESALGFEAPLGFADAGGAGLLAAREPLPTVLARQLPPVGGVEAEDDADVDEFGQAPTTVRARAALSGGPDTGELAHADPACDGQALPVSAALCALPPLSAAPAECALANVALYVTSTAPHEQLIALPCAAPAPSMLLLVGLPAARPAPGHEPLVTIAPDLVSVPAEPAHAAALHAPSAPTRGEAEAAQSALPEAITPQSGLPVPPRRESLPPATQGTRRRRGALLGIAALALVGATGLMARAGMLDALHLGFDSSAAAVLSDTHTERALSRPVASTIPEVTPAEPSGDAAIAAEVERAKRLVNAGGSAKLREAQQALEHVRAEDPQNPHVRGTLGEVLLQRGAYEAAFTEAVEAVRLRPRRARYRVLLGDVYRGLGRAEEAEKAYTRAAELDVHGRSVDDVDGASVRALSEL